MTTRMKRLGYIVARAACNKIIRAALLAYAVYALIEHVRIHMHDHQRTKR